MIDITT